MCLQARMGHGSILCAKLCVRIVSQFKDNVSQCKVAENLGLSSSAVHNIMKRFRELGKISVHKAQGRTLPLSVCDHRVLRWYFTMNRYATVIDITHGLGVLCNEFVCKNTFALHRISLLIFSPLLKVNYYCNRHLFVNDTKLVFICHVEISI